MTLKVKNARRMKDMKKYNENETPEFLEYTQVTKGLKRTTQIFFMLFLVPVFLMFFSITIGEITLGVSNEYFTLTLMVVFGVMTTLFYREYLDIREHGLEKYKQKWYYV